LPIIQVGAEGIEMNVDSSQPWNLIRLVILSLFVGKWRTDLTFSLSVHRVKYNELNVLLKMSGERINFSKGKEKTRSWTAELENVAKNYFTKYRKRTPSTGHPRKR